MIIWLESGRREFEDPRSYEQKILWLMKYAGVNLGNSEPFTKYLNQIRNQLSHGAPRVWDSVIYKKDGIENDLAVDVGRTLQRLEEVVQVAIVKLLNETG